MKTRDDIISMVGDTRPVAVIWSGSAYYAIGHDGITEIVIYYEGGEMGPINYAAIYKGNSIFARVDLKGWAVQYAVPEPVVENE